ncbi:MAG: histone deacetylase [Chloroflexi bacterium]|nr:histone deacetylase [Chloroflexota bacterium]
MSVAYCYHPLEQEHTLYGHPENRERLRGTMDLLEQQGLLARMALVEATPVSMERLQRVHSPPYVEAVQRMAEGGGGHLDPDTYVAPRSYDAALLSAGGLVNLVDAVLQGEATYGFNLMRPPGHHAITGRGMGFCIFNNVAIAARYAQAEGGVERVLIVDFDVHHGNGTQDTFWSDPSVFFFSTHQYPYYPGSGDWREIGAGEGQGTICNVPLRPGVGNQGYARVFDELLWPLAERFQPQLILVSAGYDAHWQDPLAGMRLSLSGYVYLAHALKTMADELCGGRLVFTLEGGYHLQALAHAILNTLRVLLGELTPEEGEVLDPLGPSPYDETPLDTLLLQLKGLHRLV